MAGSLNLKKRTQAQNDGQQDAKKMLNRVLRVAELLTRSKHVICTRPAVDSRLHDTCVVKNTEH